MCPSPKYEIPMECLRDGRPNILVNTRRQAMKAQLTDFMQIRFVCFQEITNMPNGFAHAATYVKCIDNWLPKIFLHSCCSHGTQIDTMERCVTPEVRFVVLFDVKRFIVEWSHM